ncbi:unnamed protein product [Symbiodinium sp. CCMP2456]|nr:unnamed protein product [Symbiodinium sp. CCMP2456]
MARFAPVDCLHMVWIKDRVLLGRLEEGGRVVKTVDNATFVKANEDNCVENRALLEAYMVRQRGARSLDIPDLESIKAQLLSMHTTYAMNCRAKASKRPKALLEATMELVQANAHLDAKALKRLFSYARRRFLSPHEPKELYGKGGKKTRWDTKDADEQAGEDDAFHEYAGEFDEEAEEEAPEDDPPLDPPLEVAPFPVLPTPPPPPVLEMPLLNAEPAPSLQRKPLLHMQSSSSIASNATTLILGETPKTPEPRTLVPAQSAQVRQMTPSPPSLPVEVRYREVLYVAESPRKMVKAEPRDFEAGVPSGVAKPSIDKDAVLHELATLEAAQKALLDAERKLSAEALAAEPNTTEPNTTEQNTREPNTTEQHTSEPGETELEPTELDEAELERADAKQAALEPTGPVDKEFALQELAVLQAELPWLRLKSCADATGPTGVLDTDDTQVAPATVLDMEAVSREDQLAARKRRKEELAAKKAAQKAQKAAVANAEEGARMKSIDQATIPEKAKEGAGVRSNEQATVPEKAKEGMGADGAVENHDGEPLTKKRKTAAKSKPKAKAAAAEASEAPEPAPVAVAAAEVCSPGRGRGRGRGGRGRGKTAANKKQGRGKTAADKKQGKSKGKEKTSNFKGKGAGQAKNAKAQRAVEPANVPERRVSTKRPQDGYVAEVPDKKAAKPKSALQSEEEKIEQRQSVLSTNGTLKHYTLMVYWSRPGLGIKQLSDGKQVQYLGGKSVPMSKIIKAGIDCVSWSSLIGCCLSRAPATVGVPLYRGSCDSR